MRNPIHASVKNGQSERIKVRSIFFKPCLIFPNIIPGYTQVSLQGRAGEVKILMRRKIHS
jgi:hypothetical protein